LIPTTPEISSQFYSSFAGEDHLLKALLKDRNDILVEDVQTDGLE
jgi:hypothetical protein